MTSLTLAFAPLFALQTLGSAPVAIENDNPETWTLEYPRLIQPFVEDYRRCLTVQIRSVNGVANFEEQHRASVPNCTEERAEAEASANGIIAGRTGYDEFGPDQVRVIFDRIGLIHIARGADLDSQFMARQARASARVEEYHQERPEGFVLELRDASVVQDRLEAGAAQRSGQSAQEQPAE